MRGKLEMFRLVNDFYKLCQSGGLGEYKILGARSSAAESSTGNAFFVPRALERCT